MWPTIPRADKFRTVSGPRFTASTELRTLVDDGPKIDLCGLFGGQCRRGLRRRAVAFEPAPVAVLRFDVEMSQQETSSVTMVLLEFTQPERPHPYLAGQVVWLLQDAAGAAVLQEEVDTPAALEIVGRPLHGSARSCRRWLFFKGGHQRLMKETASNIRALLASGAGPSR